MKDKREIDKLFQAGLTDLQRRPSADAWARIESGMAKPKKRLAAWWYSAAAAILLLAIAGAYVWFGPGDTAQLALERPKEEVLLDRQHEVGATMNSEDTINGSEGIKGDQYNEEEAPVDAIPDKVEGDDQLESDKSPESIKIKEKKRRQAYRSYMASNTGDKQGSATETDATEQGSSSGMESPSGSILTNENTLAMAAAQEGALVGGGSKMTIRIDPAKYGNEDVRGSGHEVGESRKSTFRTVLDKLKNLKEGENNEKNKLQSIKENLLAVGYED